MADHRDKIEQNKYAQIWNLGEYIVIEESQMGALWGWDHYIPNGVDEEGNQEYELDDWQDGLPSYQAAWNHAREVHPEFFS